HAMWKQPRRGVAPALSNGARSRNHDAGPPAERHYCAAVSCREFGTALTLAGKACPCFRDVRLPCTVRCKDCSHRGNALTWCSRARTQRVFVRPALTLRAASALHFLAVENALPV